jgi:hypothetical protein
MQRAAVLDISNRCNIRMTRKPTKGKTAKMETDLTERLNMVVSPRWVGAVDQWRAQQPGVPNRSEAIRKLVEMALQQQEKSAPKKK